MLGAAWRLLSFPEKGQRTGRRYLTLTRTDLHRTVLYTGEPRYSTQDSILQGRVESSASILCRRNLATSTLTSRRRPSPCPHRVQQPIGVPFPHARRLRRGRTSLTSANQFPHVIKQPIRTHALVPNNSCTDTALEVQCSDFSLH